MHRSRFAVFASFLATTLLIGSAIFSTPYMRKVLSGDAVESSGSSIGALVMFSLVGGWPWLLALNLPQSMENKNRQYLFSAVAVLIALAFYIPISTGHDFEIGLYTILCVLGIWALYPHTGIKHHQ